MERIRVPVRAKMLALFSRPENEQVVGDEKYQNISGSELAFPSMDPSPKRSRGKRCSISRGVIEEDSNSPCSLLRCTIHRKRQKTKYLPAIGAW